MVTEQLGPTGPLSPKSVSGPRGTALSFVCVSSLECCLLADFRFPPKSDPSTCCHAASCRTQAPQVPVVSWLQLTWGEAMSPERVSTGQLRSPGPI